MSIEDPKDSIPISRKPPIISSWLELQTFVQEEKIKFKRAEAHMHPLEIVTAKQNFQLWIVEQILQLELQEKGRILLS